MKSLIREFTFILLWVISSHLTQDLKPFQPCVSKSDITDESFVDGFSRKRWYSDLNYVHALTGFVLYHESSTLTIVSKYEDYSANNHLYACAVYMRSNQIDNEQYAYINFCGRELRKNELIDRFEFSLLDNDGKYGLLECKDSSENAPKGEYNFECIRYNDTTYTITTNFESNNVQVLFSFKQVNDENKIDNIIITPFNLTSSIKSTGLCGDIISNDTTIVASSYGYLTWNISAIDWKFDISENYCHSSNGQKILKTFLGKKVFKHDLRTIDTNYLLYSDTSTQITAKYEKCLDGLDNELCHCGLFIQTLDAYYPRYVFLDSCKASRSLNMNFKYYDRTNQTSLKDGIFSYLDCSSSISDENSEHEWNSIKKSFYYFKCARLATSSCETYIVEADVNGKPVRVKVDLKCPSSNEDTQYMSNIWINVPKNENKVTNGGLCGRVLYENNNKTCTHYIIGSNGQECTDNSKKLIDFWNIENSFFKVDWNLDLSSFLPSRSCVLFNYLKSITKFNDEDVIKDKNAYQISSPVILYDFDQEVMVYTRYRPCQSTFKVEYCTCSLYIRVNKSDPHFAFIDFCSSTVMNPPLLKFRYYKDVEMIPYDFLNCNITITDADNETQWNTVPTSFNYFKCAKLDSYCNTYIIRVTNTPYNIRIHADINCDDDEENDDLSQITILPALKSQNYSLGLCSDWKLDEEQTLKQDVESRQSISELYQTNSLSFYEKNDIVPKNVNEARSYEVPPSDNFTLSNRFCRMVNDPHMKTFYDISYEFQFPGEYVIYQTENLMVTATYKTCFPNIYCNCGAKVITDYKDIRRRQVQVLLDVCGMNLMSHFNCQVNLNNPQHKIKNFLNNYEWWSTYQNGRKNLKGRVDCYQYRSYSLEITNYMIWFDHNKSEGKSQTLINILRYKRSNLIHAIHVYPSLKSELFVPGYPDPTVQYNGGICGLTLPPYNTNNVQLWLMLNGAFKAAPLSYLNYAWRVESAFANYWSCGSYNHDCGKMINVKTNRGVIEQIEIDQNRTSLTKIEQIYNNQYAKSRTEYTYEYAFELCNLKLNTSEIELNEDLEKICEEAIDMCAMDLMETGDISWLDVHEKLLNEKIIKYILSDANNYGTDNLIRPDVLDMYGIRCQNDCSNNGQCIRNPTCTFGEECSDVLLCDCYTPYGSRDCSVNLKAPPPFTLVDSCYDIRKMDFKQLIGVSSKFSNNNTLYYNLKLVIDSSEKYSVIGEVDEVNENNFRINYPFGYIPEIQQNSVTLMVGISYGMDNYRWQNLTMFDSNCRTCKDGQLDDALVEGTCISKLTNVCSRKDVYGSCVNPHPCANGFDLGIIVQGSSKSTEVNFDKIKDALSEMIGRLTVNPDQVHVASLFNSQILRVYTSLKIKDQSNSRRTINKINEMPYVPYVSSSLAKALYKTSNEIFSTYRTGTSVARVALIFNDAKTNPREDLLTEAQRLKNMDVEVFVVGIGDDVDPNELNTMATSSQHVFLFATHDDIFKHLDTLTSSVCSVNNELNLGKREFFKLAPNDVRYFKLNLKNVKSGFIEILADIEQGNVKIFYSFVIKNPQIGDPESRYLMNEKVKQKTEWINGTEKIIDSYFLFIPDNAQYLYFTLVGSDKKASVYLEINEF